MVWVWASLSLCECLWSSPNAHSGVARWPGAASGTSPSLHRTRVCTDVSSAHLLWLTWLFPDVLTVLCCVVSIPQAQLLRLDTRQGWAQPFLEAPGVCPAWAVPCNPLRHCLGPCCCCPGSPVFLTCSLCLGSSSFSQSGSLGGKLCIRRAPGSVQSTQSPSYRDARQGCGLLEPWSSLCL